MPGAPRSPLSLTAVAFDLIGWQIELNGALSPKMFLAMRSAFPAGTTRFAGPGAYRRTVLHPTALSRRPGHRPPIL